jgi:predicted MFS family arabinose efflux permease
MALGLAGLCAFLNLYSTQPLLPLLSRIFGVSKAGAGLTISAPTIAVALVSPFMGAAADQIGRRRTMVLALCALAVPTLLASTATGISSLVFWRFLQGLAIPGVSAVGIAYAGAVWQGRGVGRAMAALVTGNVLGGFLGRFVTGFAAEHASWRVGFLVLGALTAAGAVAAARLLPPEPRRSGAHLGVGASLRALSRRLGDRRLLAPLCAGFCVLFGQVATFTYVTFYLAGPPFLLSPSALSGIFAVYLVGALVTPAAGGLIDRFGSRAVLLAAAATGLAGSALTLSHALPVVIAGLILTCTAVFVSQSAATAYLPTAVPAEIRSPASGLYLSCYYLGGAVAGVAPALTWNLGGWTACVALVMGVQVVSGVVALGLERGPRASTPVVAPGGE